MDSKQRVAEPYALSINIVDCGAINNFQSFSSDFFWDSEVSSSLIRIVLLNDRYGV